MRSRGNVHYDFEEALTQLGIFLTVTAATLLTFDVGGIMADGAANGSFAAQVEQFAFIAIVYALIYGNLSYQLSRLGSIRRHRSHPPAPADLIEPFVDGKSPSLTVLVPAYKEEPEVVYRTLLSAALMDYPSKRVVLLIDDPPAPTSPHDAEALAAMRGLPERLTALLARPRVRLEAELCDFRVRAQGAGWDPGEELEQAARLSERCASWYESLATTCTSDDHAARFFVEAILRGPAGFYRDRARWLRDRAAAPNTPTPEALEREYRRLLGMVNTEFAIFERKRYANLSKEVNKAMNLNSYIVLMGKRVREVIGADGELRMEVCAPGERGNGVPDSDYLVTLDADSLLLRDYALRLVRFMEAPENARYAIAQAPYSAYPEAPAGLERIAGATTDIQHIVHQGFTQYNGTYWVGANALIRRRALEDIAVTEREGDLEVVKYIMDRTVIEDTESTVDLMAKGWRLHNYPARLAYSATPPDFGSLIIQRRRWSNGGLIILPKLLRLLHNLPMRGASLLQGLVQIHYLTSPAATSAGVLLLIIYSFEDSMRSLWLPLTALPYFYLYGRDLVQAGYRWSDLPRVYALNLMLMPVQLGGVGKSLQQAATGRKSPFGRTPKLQVRTAAPRLYVGSVLLICIYCLVGAAVDLHFERWAHSAFAFVNGLFFTYAIATFIGLRCAFEDLTLGRFGAREVTGGEPIRHRLRLAHGQKVALNGPGRQHLAFEPAWRGERSTSPSGPM